MYKAGGGQQILLHVVIDGNKYAGTWAHGKVGGHLYGRISKIKEEEME